jgi:hypothetical protein
VDRGRESALAISGYLGKTEKFDEAMGSFAVAYADQTERDHAAMKAAVRSGKIKVQSRGTVRGHVPSL